MKTRITSLHLLTLSIAALVLLSLPGRCLLAADHPGQIWGTIRNESGSPLTGAKITLTDGVTAIMILSSGDGTYTLAPVKPGVYILTAELKGYEKAERPQVTVTGDQRVLVNFSLVPEKSSEKRTEWSAGDAKQSLASGGYFDEPEFKPSTLNGAVDPGGYSSPGQTQTSSRLLQGVATLKKEPATANGGDSAQPEVANPRALAAMEAELKKVAENAPRNYEANHNLGEFYIHAGKLPAGIPYLERAQHLDATHYDNCYDLALAYLETHNLEKARAQILQTIARQDTAELHNLLGEVEEGLGQYIDAANEYERAAHMQPSEQNIFDWGSELLLHLTFEPAVEVFKHGVALYPRSPELLIGLGVALYSRGGYDDAIQALSMASDLKPSDPTAYLFLGRMYNVSTVAAGEVTTRLERFIKLQPQNAVGRYYYAMSVWKGQRGQNGQVNFEQIESLLKDAVALDPKLAGAHLELGNLYSEQRKYAEAITEYQQAIKLQPDLVDAHYRLAQAYSRTGEQTRAREEFELHGRLHKQQLAETEKQRAEIRQFVYSMKDVSKH